MRTRISIVIVSIVLIGNCLAQSELQRSRARTYITTSLCAQIMLIEKQNTPVNQISFPVSLIFPVGRHVQITIDHSPAFSSWADTADIRISGLSDTWIQGTFFLLNEKAYLNVGIGVPTGKSPLNNREFLLSQLLDDNIYRFRVPAYTQGLCRKAGVGVAIPVGENAIMGMGVQYVNHQAYVPVRYVYEVQGVQKVSEEEYKPGNEITGNIGFDLRLREDMKLMVDGIYTHYDRDLLSGQEIYGSGSKFLMDVGFLYQFSQQYLWSRVQYRQKGKNEIWQGLSIQEEVKNSTGLQTEIELIFKALHFQNGGFFLYGDGRIYGANEKQVGRATLYGTGFGANYQLSDVTTMDFHMKLFFGNHYLSAYDKRDIVGLEIFLGWNFKL